MHVLINLKSQSLLQLHQNLHWHLHLLGQDCQERYLMVHNLSMHKVCAMLCFPNGDKQTVKKNCGYCGSTDRSRSSSTTRASVAGPISKAHNGSINAVISQVRESFGKYLHHKNALCTQSVDSSCSVCELKVKTLSTSWALDKCSVTYRQLGVIGP